MGFLDTYENTDPAAPPPDEPAQPKTTGFLSEFGGESGPVAGATTPPKHGVAETAALHGIQGITAGFGDELSGLGAVSGANRPSLNPVDLMHGLARMGYEKLTGGHENSDTYTKARDARRKELEESQAEHPIVALGSDVAGSFVQPGGSLLKAAGLGSRLVRGAIVGAGQGAVRGAGEAPELGDIPADAAKGAGIGAVIGGPLNAAVGPRMTSVAKKELMDAAEKYGVQLPKYMVSDNPLTQFYGKSFEQLPFVGSALSGAASKAHSGVKAIRDEIVDGAIGQGATPTEARTIASQIAEDARNEFVKNSKKISENNFDNVKNTLSNPNYVAPLNNLEQAVDDLTQKYAGSGVRMSPLLRQATRGVEKQGMTYEEMKFLRTSLSKEHEKLKRAGGVDYAEYSQLRGALTDDMEQTILRAGGPRSLAMWESANLQHGIGKDIGKSLDVAIGKGTGDTSAADTIYRNISSARPNIPEINQLRNVMKPDDWAAVQAATLARMGADDAGNFSIAKLLTADKKLSDAGKNAMFGFAGSAKRDGYDAIVKIGGAMQKLDRFTNYSRTATLGTGVAALYELYNNPINGAKEIAGGALLGMLLARPATARNAGVFAKALDRYVSNPAAVASGKVPRALELAGRNLAISAVAQKRKDANNG